MAGRLDGPAEVDVAAHSSAIVARLMSDQSRYEFVSVAEAARRLKLSVSMVKRRIHDGLLEAEAVSRPQGIEYHVQVPRLQSAPTTAAPDSEEAPPPMTNQQDVSSALTMRMLDTLDAVLRANGETMERQADTIARLSDQAAMWRTRTQEAGARADRAELERAAAETERDYLKAQLDQARRRPWWRRLW